MILIYQVQKILITLLFIEKVIILAKYLDFVNNFLKKIVINLLKYSDINKYVINLEIDMQLLYKLIYSFEFIELETIKIYIKIILANGFILFFKSFTRAIILFIKISDKKLYLYFNFQVLNNLPIKN